LRNIGSILHRVFIHFLIKNTMNKYHNYNFSYNLRWQIIILQIVLRLCYISKNYVIKISTNHKFLVSYWNIYISPRGIKCHELNILQVGVYFFVLESRLGPVKCRFEPGKKIFLRTYQDQMIGHMYQPQWNILGHFITHEINNSVNINYYFFKIFMNAITLCQIVKT
jgi:hypothetical protein